MRIDEISSGQFLTMFKQAGEFLIENMIWLLGWAIHEYAKPRDPADQGSEREKGGIKPLI
jgi:hypothetical protein